MDQLPEDPALRMNLEVDMAYIAHDLYRYHKIILSKDRNTGRNRALEILLDESKCLSPYTSLSQGSAGKDIIQMDDAGIADYLEYLFSHSSYGVSYAMIYIESCIELSRLPRGGEILMKHLAAYFASISDEDKQSLLAQHRYTK